MRLPAIQRGRDNVHVDVPTPDPRAQECLRIDSYQLLEGTSALPFTRPRRPRRR